MQDTESARVQQLVQELTHDRVHVRRSAVGTLVNILVSDDDVSPGVQSVVVAALLARLQDLDYSVCTASIRALRAIGVDTDDATQVQARVQTLLDTLRAEFPNVRRFAVTALAEAIQHDNGAPNEAPAAVVMALLDCVQDEEHGVRSAAVRALRAISLEAPDATTARDRLRALLDILDSRHVYVRRFGVGALIEVLMHHADVQRDYQSQVMSGLQERLDDTDHSVRSAAANAIKILS